VSVARPSVNGEDPRFFDFYYPWEPGSPSGVYEVSIDPAAVSKINEIADDWSRHLPEIERQRFVASRCDCQVAKDWAAVLANAGVSCREEGQVVDRLGDKPQSGYLVESGLVFPHLWVVIGREQLIFDPTASQFHKGGACDTGNPEAKGPISLDRYVVNGQPLVAIRPTTPLSRRRGGHS